MTRWRFPLLMVGVAVVAGSIGRWTDPMLPQAGAQESRPSSAQQGGTQAPGETAADDRGWIGLMVENGPDGAILVKDVFPGGPGAFARVRQGDAILKAGDVNVRSEEDLEQAVEQLTPGKETVVVVRRNGQELPLRVHVGSLRDFHQRYAHEMWHRDPRDPNYAQGHGISQADLSVELVRRLFEQNERIETSLHELRQEVSELRREQKSKAGADR